MLHTLTLLLPALVPSWRFFDWIAPAPHIEYTLLETPQNAPEQWHILRPRPAQLSAGEMARRLFYNPRGNERLFLVSCAERLAQNPSEHSVQEILARIRADIRKQGSHYVQFRVVFTNRKEQELEQRVAYISTPYPAQEAA